MTLPKLEVGYGLGREQASFTTGARSATQAMSGIKDCPLAAVLVFASVKYDLEAVLQGIYSVVGDVPLIGATTAGEICNEPQQESVVVVALASPYLKVRVGLGEGVSKNWRQAVAQAVSSPEIEPFFSPHSLIWQELALQGKSAFALLFSPGNTRTADSQSFEILEELTYLSRGYLPIMGGGAADDWRMEANYSLWGQRAYVDSVLVAVFETQLRFGIAMAHGYYPSSRKGTVTHSHNHEVLEIKGEPAAEVYCRLHNSSREALEGKHLTLTTEQPMGMLDPYGQYRLNVASYFTDAGGVRFAQPTPEGTILTVMEANPDSQVAAGPEALRKALLRGAITDPGMALVFSCALRRHILEKRIAEEIDGIQDLIPGVPVVGFYSFGEQGQSDYGVNRHNNVVIAILTLGREFSFGAQVALENEQLRLNLEQKTADLMATNRKLFYEIGVRHLAEKELSKSHQDLQKTVQQLEQSRNLLQLIIESIPIRVFWKDLDSHYLGCNTLFARDAGLGRPEQLLGQDDFAMGWEEQARLYREDDRQVMESGCPKMNIIEPQTTPTGAKVWLKTSKVPLLRPNGEVFGVLGVYEDITERKRNEEQLRQAQKEWERTFNTIPSLIMILDHEHRIVKVNQALAQAFGYSPDEMVGKLCYQVVHGSEGPPAFCPHRRLLSHGYTGPVEVWHEDLQRYLLVTVTPLYDRSGSFLGSVHVANDITERKLAEEALRKSEEEYRLLVGQIPAVVFKGYVDWGVDCFDDKIETLTGYSKEDFNFRRVIWRDLIPEEELPYVKQIFREALRGDRSFMREHRIRKKDGSYAWVQSRGQIFCNEQGEVEYISGVTFDVTNRKQAEESLRRREAVLEAVSLAAERFLKTDFWEENLTDILGRLGQAMEVSRVYIFENHQDEDGTFLTSQRFEWVAPGIKSEMDNPDNQNFPYQTGGMGRFAELMARGEIVHGNIKDIPAEEQAILAPQGIKSIVTMPIFVEDYWWGLIGFDDCLREREWAAVEIEALKTAANMLGAAILHSQSEKALKESEERLRALSYQLLDVQENERKRLALELHDVLGHDLLNLKLKLESFRGELLPEHIYYNEEVTKIIHAIQGAVKNVRLLYQDLIPADLEELGLTTALENMLEEFALAKRVTWEAQLDHNIDTLFDLPLQTNIYRLVQEGLTNIGKHAEATHIFLRARKNQTEVTLILEDNGIGFNLSEVRTHKKTMGLLSMEKRLEPWGGSFEIQSQPEQGTRICVTIPISKRK